MKSKSKRLVKRLFKLAKIPFLIGLGLFFGLIIGSESRNSTVIIQPDGRYAEEYAHTIERQVQERLAEEGIVPPIPTVPPIAAVPPMPNLPPMPEFPPSPEFPEFHTNFHIERGFSFWDLVNGVRTVLASLVMLVLGGMILRRHWRTPKEKSPESIGV